ncbi:hypothetical protein [Streptomyces aureus]|uniref:hypothetical protein n=1 Tax=Streptomyces aureus TaxID=193461 RepID=UPI0033C503F8
MINDDILARARLNWLERQQHGYAPRPFEQLAAAYRQAGHEDAARLVAIHKQRRRRRTLNPAGRLIDWLLYLTVGYGYGYRTWLAARAAQHRSSGADVGEAFAAHLFLGSRHLLVSRQPVYQDVGGDGLLLAANEFHEALMAFPICSVDLRWPYLARTATQPH